MKIKEKLLELKDFIKKFFSEYPFTMIIIFAYTIFFSFIYEIDCISNDWIEKISAFGIIWIFGVFFIENLDKLGTLVKTILKCITAVVAIGFVWVMFEMKVEINFWMKVLCCYLGTLSLLSLFFIIKRTGKEISEYILKVFINLTKLSFVYGILALGVLCIYEIFNFLILDSRGEFIDNLEVLLFGFYYVPKLIYSFTDIKEEVNSFFKGLVKWVLMSFVLLAFAIIYAYIIKILVLRNMPKNQIFRILTALFVMGAPIWTSMQYFKDDSFVYKISLKLPVAFIPFIFLQIYTIGVRISENGVTPLRYMCVAFVIFEIIYEIYYILRKDKIKDLIIVANIMLIFVLLVPGLNMDDFSNMSQAKRLKLYKEKSSFTDEEKSKIYGAYSYLKFSENGNKYIEAILNEDDEEEIKEFRPTANYNYDIYEYFNYYNYEKVDVSEYNSLIKVEASVYSRYGDGSGVDSLLEKASFKSNDKEVIKIDCLDHVEDMIKLYKKNDNNVDSALKYIKDNNEIKINKDSKLVITEFSFRYNIETDKVESFSCEGYFLEK